MPRSRTSPTPTASPLYRLVAWSAFALMHLQRWRMQIRRLDHVPRHAGAVLAVNHTSFWDFFTVGYAPFRRWRRPVRILAKESLFRAPVLGTMMRRAEHIPVHRGAGASALSSAVAALRRGDLILVLPEQTVSPSFELLPFKTGAARMAAEAGVALVPCVSWGSHRFHTVKRPPRWSWRLPVVIAYGEPMYPTPDDDPDQVTAELSERIATLLDEVQRSYPDGAPAGAWWVPARLGGGAPTFDQAQRYIDELSANWREAAAQRVEHAVGRVQEGTQHAVERVQEGTQHARERMQEGASHARERMHDGVDHVRDRIRAGDDQAPGTTGHGTPSAVDDAAPGATGEPTPGAPDEATRDATPGALEPQ